MSYNIGSVDRNGLYRRNLSHYAPTLPVDLIKTKCPYIKVRNKISNVVRWIFKQISSLFFSKPKKVKKREVAAREYARNITEIKATRPEPPKRPVPASTSDEKKSNQPTIENPVMREFHVVTQELVGTTIDTVFEKKIRPKLSGFQEGLDKASEFTHLGADLAITVGVKVMPSLFNKLKEFNAKEKIQPELKKLLNWLLQVENKPKLEKDLRERIKSIQIGEKEKDLCLDWLLRTEHDQSLEDFYSGPGIKIEGKEKQIEKMFEEAILLLAESKIRQYTRLWHEKMDTQLPDIIHKTMLINGQKVSSILIQRLIALLEKTKCKTAPEKTKYTTAFDELTGMVFDQTKAVIAVEEAKKRMIKKKEPEKAEENGLLVYAYQRLCHPKISELIGRTDLTVAQKEEMEKEFFENIAKRMIPLLFPDQTVQLPGGQEH
ncbi:MAG: hypothetical protein ACE5HI_13675, partial [bacterium]